MCDAQQLLLQLKDLFNFDYDNLHYHMIKIMMADTRLQPHEQQGMTTEEIQNNGLDKVKLILILDQDRANEEKIVEGILEDGHDWAQDHIAEAKNNMDQVFDFLMNESKKDGMELSMNIDDKDMVMMEGRKKLVLSYVLVVKQRLKQNTMFI